MIPFHFIVLLSSNRWRLHSLYFAVGLMYTIEITLRVYANFNLEMYYKKETETLKHKGIQVFALYWVVRPELFLYDRKYRFQKK
jgi:hypothetical protein